MKDSIQKIIDKLKDKTWYNPKDTTGTEWIELTWEETHLLLDYITYLQKENKKQLNNVMFLSKVADKKQNIINELEKASDEIFHKYPYERHQWFLKLRELKGSDK